MYLGTSNGSKVIRDDASSWGPEYERVSQGQYNAYRDMVDWLNKQYQAGDDRILDYGTVTGTKAVKKKHRAKSATTSYENQYGVQGNREDNTALNDYLDYMQRTGTNDFDAYKQQQANTFATNYAKYADEALKSQINNYLGGYNTGRQSNVSAADQAKYTEAKEVLDRQLARGYLSGIGYQKALSKLNEQQGSNQTAMSNAYNALYNDFEDDLSQAWQKGLITPGEYDWLNAADNLNFTDAYGNLAGISEGINDDAFRSAMYAANIYNPDEYIAYGAENQGQYDPTFDSTSGGKKKRPVSTTGINEV